MTEALLLLEESVVCDRRPITVGGVSGSVVEALLLLEESVARDKSSVGELKFCRDQ